MDTLRTLIAFICFFLPTLTYGGDPLSLSSFPVKKTLWLSMSKSYVAPAQAIEITSNLEGYLQINVANHSHLKKGEVWAIKSPKKLDFSEKTLALEKEKLQQTIRTVKLDHLDNISTQEEKIASLTNELKKLQAASHDPEIATNQHIKSALSTSIKKINAQISRSQQRLKTLTSQTSLQNKISRLTLDFEQKQTRHQTLKKSSELTAPFDCTLNLEIPSPESPQEIPFLYWSTPGMNIGTLSNNARFEISVPAVNPSLFQVDKNTLFVIINRHRRDRAIHANYLRTIQKNRNRLDNSSPTLIFQVEKQDSLKAQELSNTQPIAQIYTKLPPNCHIIPKSKLLSYLDRGEEQSSWRATIEKLWPGAKLIAIGKNSLAVQAPTHP